MPYWDHKGEMQVIASPLCGPYYPTPSHFVTAPVLS